MAQGGTVEAVPDLETLLTDPGWFGLPQATDVQRAMCRIADGFSLGRLAESPLVAAALARETPKELWRDLCWGASGAASRVDWSGVAAWESAVASSDGERPGCVDFVSSVRSGKTLIATCGIVRNSWVSDISLATTPGELPRATFSSLTRDLATVAFQKLVATMQKSARLSSYVVSEPADSTIILRRPDRKYIEAKVLAADKAGASLSARWIAAALFDEAPKMGGSECAVSHDALVSVAQERLLHRAQIFDIGSPWAAIGPVYEAVRDHAGRPTMHRVIIRAPGPALNPTLWTRVHCERVEARAKGSHREAMINASLWAVFIEDSDVVLIPPSHVDAARRDAPEALEPAGWPCVATMDPATRSNAWTLTITVRDPRTNRLRVALPRQWRSQGLPLDPTHVLREVAAECARYGTSTVYTDMWSSDSLRAIAREFGLDVVERSLQGNARFQAYDALRLALVPGPKRLELPPDVDVANDLKRIRRVLTRDGMTVGLATTPDGRHCDYAPALALAITNAPPEVAAARPKADPDEESDDEEDILDRGVDLERLERRLEVARFRRDVLRQ